MRHSRIWIVFALAALVIAVAAGPTDAQGWRGGAGRGAGGSALSAGAVPGVQLTPEQERQVAEIRSQTMQKVQAVRWDSSLSAEEKAAEIARIRQEGHERVLSILTPEQRQQFESRWPGGRVFDGTVPQGPGLGRGPCGAGLGPGAGAGRGAGPGRGRGFVGGGGFGAGAGMSGLVPGVQLSAGQQERIRQIRQDGAREAAAVMADPGLNAQQKAQMVQQIRQRTHERVMQELTPQQRQQFQQRAGAGRMGPPR